MRKTKKFTALLLALIMALSMFTVAPFTVSAATTEDEIYTSGDFKYKILDDNTAIIEYYIGDETVVEIPSKLDGHPVISTGTAFYMNTSLTSIILPDSITSIDNYAFRSCTSLKNISIPNSVTSIGDWAFYYCISLTDVNIPNSVKSIGTAFVSCENLVSVTLPDSITRITSMTFKDCSNLTSITIPNKVTSIGGGAFYECTSLKSITIPNSVMCIDNHAFENCTSLKDVYYSGSKEDWQKINISNEYDCNESLINATIHYNYTANEPSSSETSESSSETEPSSEITEPSLETESSSETTDPAPTYEFGDVNMDGVIDSDDVVMLQEYLAEKITLAEAQKALADINGDGIITETDLSVLITITDYVDPSETAEPSSETTEPSTEVEPSPETTEPSSETEPTPEYKFGDVNLDGDVNVKDATLIQQIVVEMAGLDINDLQKGMADIDGDGEITVKDATTLQTLIVNS